MAESGGGVGERVGRAGGGGDLGGGGECQMNRVREWTKLGVSCSCAPRKQTAHGDRNGQNCRRGFALIIFIRSRHQWWLMDQLQGISDIMIKSCGEWFKTCVMIKTWMNDCLLVCGEPAWRLAIVPVTLTTHTHTHARARTHARTRTHTHTRHARTRTHARTTRAHTHARTHARTHTL